MTPSEEAVLAEVLARVAGDLRAAGAGDEVAERLTAQLEAARELREALERLEAPGPGQPGNDAGGASDGRGDTAGRRQAFVDRLGQRPGLVDELRRMSPELEGDLQRWAEHWQSLSSPGTDRARLDGSAWESLRDHLDSALRQFEAERSRELANESARDRFATGADGRVPDRYRRLIDAYYRSLATASSPVAGSDR